MPCKNHKKLLKKGGNLKYKQRIPPNFDSLTWISPARSNLRASLAGYDFTGKIPLSAFRLDT
jgi:hypothetical protein